MTTSELGDGQERNSCPKCGEQLTNVGAFSICPKHGQIVDESPRTALRIFLSYGHDRNEELVQRIRADLSARGHDVWFDKNEIKFGDHWRRSITDGILNSNRVLSFLSKHSTRDPGVCLDEIAIAVGVKGGNIQTILVEREEEVQPPPSISHVQWLDMHDWASYRASDEAEWERWYQEKFAEMLAVIESAESRRFAGEIQMLEERLRPISSDTRLAQLLKTRLVGRKWLFEAVERWRTSSDRGSRVFWISGIPGVGKSAFAAHLAHYGQNKVIAVQFCEWDKPEQRDAHRIVRTLAFQIASRFPDYRKLLVTLPEMNATDLDRRNPSELFDYLVANPLNQVIDGGQDRYLVLIDALDEAAEEGRNPLVELLARDVQRLPEWIGVVATSRPESNVTEPLQALRPVVLETETDSNRADIREFIEERLASHLEARTDRAELVDRILENSEGVFLYVERFAADVHQGHISLDEPERFPQGLGGVYYQYFQRQFSDVQHYRAKIRPALRAILAAIEPLPLSILRSVLTYDPEDFSDVLRELGALFQRSGEVDDETIKPFHKSIDDWLTNEGTAGAYFVEVRKGHQALAEAGAADFWRTGELPRYFGDHLLSHALRAGDWNLLEQLLVNDEFLKKTSGKIRQHIPTISAAEPTGMAAGALANVPERYLALCRDLQESEFVPERLIPADAFTVIMHRQDGVQRHLDDFVVTVSEIFKFYTRALEIAVKLAELGAYDGARLRSLLEASTPFQTMADSVWDRDLELVSGTLANFSGIASTLRNKATEILAQA